MSAVARQPVPIAETWQMSLLATGQFSVAAAGGISTVPDIFRGYAVHFRKLPQAVWRVNAFPSSSF